MDNISKALVGAVCGLGMFAFAPRNADAALLVDLVQTGTGLHTVDVTGATVGQSLSFNIVATVSGSDGSVSNEYLQTVFGSITQSLKNSGSVKGNLSVSINTAVFNSNTYAGVSQDINGDGVVDLGATTGSTVASDYIYGRASAQVQGTSFIVGTVTYSITDIVGTGTTSLVWVPRTNTDGSANYNAASWKEDNTAYNPTKSGASYTGGLGIDLTVTSAPEPASIGILAIAGAGLLARRRR